MDTVPRHQCLIYNGAPSQLLPMLAAVIRDRLDNRYRCLYLNTPPMVAGLRSYLAARGVDVEKAIADGSLLLWSEQSHLVDGRFDVDRMMQSLQEGLEQALRDGYAGLWATGDMSWEMGPDRDYTRLLEYEWRLEEFFRGHPQLGGICQYHAGTLPEKVLRQGLLLHPAIFVNEMLSRVNPNYLPQEAFTKPALDNPQLDAALLQLVQQVGAD